MATLDYTRRLLNLQNRKYDTLLNESRTSKSFNLREIPENVKYLLEAMRPIDQSYNLRTLDAAERVQKHLEDGLQFHLTRTYRTQGSVVTRTNIRVHSDYDLLTVIDDYAFVDGTPESPYDKTDHNDDIIELRRQSTLILKSIYDEVDDTGNKCITIRNKGLKRNIDVVFCFWHNSSRYIETKDEYYRGIHLYDFPSKSRLQDFPFAHMGQVNEKGDYTKDGSRCAIRLLKNLKADAENEIQLSSFQLTTLIHSIDNTALNYKPGENELGIAEAVAQHLGNLIDNPEARKVIKSPNGMETPLSNDKIAGEIKKLKGDLDLLIADSSKEILGSYHLKRILLSY